MKHDQKTKYLTVAVQTKQHEAVTLAKVCLHTHSYVYA